MGLYVVIPLCPFFQQLLSSKLLMLIELFPNWKELLQLSDLSNTKCSTKRIISSFWSGKLSATNNASATSVLSLMSCSTGFANKCWFTRKYHKNKNDPVRLLPSANG